MNSIAPTVSGPRYTISGDFHYCVVEAESSSAGTFSVAAALSDSPGARPGEEWRKHWEDVLWLLPTQDVAPLTFCLRSLNNWYYPGSAVCLTCGGSDCHGGCYPESEPIKAKPARLHIALSSDGRHCLNCWNPIRACDVCGEASRCECRCNNANCSDF